MFKKSLTFRQKLLFLTSRTNRNVISNPNSANLVTSARKPTKIDVGYVRLCNFSTTYAKFTENNLPSDTPEVKESESKDESTVNENFTGNDTETRIDSERSAPQKPSKENESQKSDSQTEQISNGVAEKDVGYGLDFPSLAEKNSALSASGTHTSNTISFRPKTFGVADQRHSLLDQLFDVDSILNSKSSIHNRLATNANNHEQTFGVFDRGDAPKDHLAPKNINTISISDGDEHVGNEASELAYMRMVKAKDYEQTLLLKLSLCKNLSDISTFIDRYLFPVVTPSNEPLDLQSKALADSKETENGDNSTLSQQNIQLPSASAFLPSSKLISSTIRSLLGYKNSINLVYYVYNQAYDRYSKAGLHSPLSPYSSSSYSPSVSKILDSDAYYWFILAVWTLSRDVSAIYTLSLTLITNGIAPTERLVGLISEIIGSLERDYSFSSSTYVYNPFNPDSQISSINAVSTSIIDVWIKKLNHILSSLKGLISEDI
ncbi:hypothetical protein AX774_g1798 [Zancudomyces culisetae]|uniref:Mtf2-like C-terminal domain-containing protein n=1 Tax=Zancudomyces culisetae TaxID=1213189 RepID=A0A1R1PUQ0_ZANCU|nr:hypothetical protein AX774_g1798 [Zancudomyces culisetae]|eukprot:OMH84667.1 hypothetical protein AX774_g1798 [Zancudomyces culisetae]